MVEHMTTEADDIPETEFIVVRDSNGQVADIKEKNEHAYDEAMKGLDDDV